MLGQRQRAAKQYFNHRKVKTVDNMRTYAELVKEAIRAAYEKSENEYKNLRLAGRMRQDPFAIVNVSLK